MKRSILVLIAMAVCVVLGLGSCRPPVLNKETAPKSLTVIAKADRGYALTAKDFYNSLYYSRTKTQGGYLTEPEIQWLLDSLVLDTLTGFAADDLDLGKYYNEYWIYKSRYNSALSGKYLQKNVMETVTIDSMDVLAYHKDHARRFEIQEQANVLHIMTSPVAFRNGRDSLKYRALTEEKLEETVRDYAFHLRRLVDSGMAFKEVAVKYSQDVTTKNQGGDMGWVTRGVYRPPFDSVVFSMKPGDISQPYRDADGWHILQVVDYLAAGPTPIGRPEFFEQAKQTALKERQTIRIQKIVDSLSKDVDLTVNTAILDTDVFLVPDSTWAAVVGKTDTIDIQMMKTLDDAYRSRYNVKNTTPDHKKAILATLVQRLLLVQAARRDGLDTLPEVKAEEHHLRHAGGKSLLIQRWWNRDWRPTDTAIEDYYNAHKAEFIVDKPLTVQQIVTKDSVTAMFIRDQAMSGVDFMQLAREYYPGEASVREALADLGKIGSRDVDSAFFIAAWGTPVGEVSMPVKTRYGYHIIKVLAHQESKTLEDARAEISVRLEDLNRRQEMRKKKDDLVARYHAVFPKRVKSVFLDPVAYRTK